MTHRELRQTQGRWISPDPAGLSAANSADPQSWNRYAYAGNNPLSHRDPTGLDFYLSCQNTGPCQQQIVGYDKNGVPQTSLVQGTLDAQGNFTATQIGNDANGNLVDRTTGTGAYTADVTGSGVQLSNNGGATSATGVFVNTDVEPTGSQLQSYDTVVQAGNLPGFLFTFTNSKMEANQTAAGFFSFSGTVLEADHALQAAGFKYEPLGLNFGKNEYRSPGTPGTGANSGHFNVQPGVPTFGNMHFGEHNPFASAEAAWKHLEELF